jgi:pyruvate,water dikinase
MTATGAATFSVPWADRAEAELTWRQSKMHWPDPVRRLSFDLGAALASVGFGRTDVALGRPSLRRFGLFNGYVYGTRAPLPGADGADRERLGRFLEDELSRNVMAQWRAVLPEIEAHLAALERFDPQASPAELLVQLELGVLRGQRLWELHALVLGPGFIAVERFVQLYTELFPDEGELPAMRLLEGEPTKTIEAAAALAALARDLATDPAVRAVIEATEPDRLAGALSAILPAWTKVHAHLQRFGRRTPTGDPAYPDLIEDPTAVLRDLRAHVVDPTRDPAAEQRRAVAERDRAFAAALERLHGYPRAVHAALETWLHAARATIALMETHNFYIDFGYPSRIRRLALALGARIADAGSIERADDVFDLTLDELRATVARPVDRRALVRERVSELAAQRRVVPPPVIGAAPAAVPADEPADPRVRANARFMGAPVAQTDDPRVVRGHAGSSGTVRGIARVVRSFAEAERVAAGEVLVAPTTASPWTPLFGRIAAVVTDTGGSLSHCAIVAREYHIPAVVGCGDACLRIPDGSQVEVNGEAGEVRVLAGPA